MPCDRKSAIRRLLNLHVERLSVDRDYAVPVAKIVTEENVANVCMLDLYAEYDYPPISLRDCERDIRLLQAWLAPRNGREQ